jgi:hypothetical protein
LAGRPTAHLALARIEIAELFDQASVATNDLCHQILPPLLGYSNRFILQEPSDRGLVTSKQQRFQPLFGQQPSSGFKGEGVGIRE